jgi:hypothetical protein
MQSLGQFVAGNRPEHVMLFQRDGTGPLSDNAQELGHEVADGTVIVAPAVMAQEIVSEVLSPSPTEFTDRAREREGEIESFLTAGTCPDAGEDDGKHLLEQLFAFVQPEDQSLGEMYAKGDVMHAYAQCSCQAHYSDKWVIDV